MRIASGARREQRWSTVRRKGDRRTTETVKATRARAASPTPPPLPALAPAAPRRKNATTARTIPGTAERCSGFGVAGRPASADTIEIRFMARAGLDEAKRSQERRVGKEC